MPEEPVSNEFVPIYSGRSPQFDLVDDTLRQAGFTTARKHEDPASPYPTTVMGVGGLVAFKLFISREEYDSRRDEVELIVRELGGGAGEDPGAIAEAEEDYDVRGCPKCGLFFHDTYQRCPGCDTELVPAVEIFDEGQLEPDRVIVGHGTEPEVHALQRRLHDAGFDAQAFEVDDWTADVVDVPWSELTDRTANVEAVLNAR